MVGIRPLLTIEEFDTSKVMLMSIPDVNGSLYDVSFEDVMKIFNVEKAVRFDLKV